MKKSYIIITILFLCFTQHHLCSMENSTQNEIDVELERSEKIYKKTIRIIYALARHLKQETIEISEDIAETIVNYCLNTAERIHPYLNNPEICGYLNSTSCPNDTRPI